MRVRLFRAHARVVMVAVAGLCAASSVSAQQGTGTVASTGEAWQIVQLPQSSIVLARDGSRIGEIGREMRTSVTLRSLPRYVSEAFIAVEDQRFYQHDGVDVIGVLGAIKGKVLRENRGGASTITQQLVGYMHPDIIDRHEISGAAGLSRKLHEQAAAREMEKHYTKEQILEAYLNQINLGRGWYGVESGAWHYFGHSASRLTLAEAATLAGLPKSQPQYDPISHPAAALDRRNLILQKMVEQGFIPPSVGAKAMAEAVKTAPNAGMSAPSDYFVDVVRQQAERAGIPVMNGGYKIYTTLDPALQRSAVAALVNGTNKIEKMKGYRHLTEAAAKNRETDYLQGMAVALDPFTGDVRALVGGRNHARAPYDRAVSSLRQPGSSFKPIVYAVALTDSIPANAIVPDTALHILLPTGEMYEPTEDDAFMGDMTIREGLIHSRNMVAIQLGMRVGMDSVAALSRRLGITTPVVPVPASAIGASDVHPIELVAAYSAFVDNGAVVQPRFITRIDDLSGRAVYARPPSTPEQVIDPRVAFIVRDMMKDVADRGTGTQARAAVPSGIPVAGKTGTTNDNVDVWFVGMTPNLVAGVWLGFDRPKTIYPGAYGGGLAAPIWGQMIGDYYPRGASLSWGPPPDGLVYADLDRTTGQLATSLTPMAQRYTEFFIPGTEPPELRNNPWKVPHWGPLFVAPRTSGAPKR